MEMNGFWKNVFVFLFAIVVISCEEKVKSPQELFDETKSGVVVILNKYYYELQLPNGGTLYFSGFDEDGDLANLTPDIEDMKDNCSVLTGSGFFVDDKGSIITNDHVVNPQIDNNQVTKNYRNLLKAIKELYRGRMGELQIEYNRLENEKIGCLGYDEYGNLVIQDDYTFQQIKEQQDEMEKAYNELSSSIEDLDDNLSMTGYKVRCVSKIGIAYDDTFINTIDDFFGRNECVVVKTSSDEKMDLAMIQLKDKKTPEGKHVFLLNRVVEQFSISDIFKKKHSEEMQIDQQLYMIGYNAGLVLASTKQGIKVQMTSGKVTQLPDGQRLMYSIPAIKGSSGSPVLNEWGEVVAVNFAGFGTTGDFNFGIPIEQVRKFKNQ